MNNKLKLSIGGAVVLCAIVLGFVSLRSQGENILIEDETVDDSSIVCQNQGNELNNVMSTSKKTGLSTNDDVMSTNEEVGLPAGEEVILTSADSEILSGDNAVSDNTGTAISSGGSADSTGTNAKDISETEIVVHVCGQVMSPGVYTLKTGSRIYEAIDCAGGVTTDADADYLNQADMLQDGMKIYVPSVEDTKELDKATKMSGEDVLKAVTTPVTVNYQALNNADSVSSSKAIGAGSFDSGVSGEQGSGNTGVTSLVNINTATKDELMTLPGVGESKANSIISYRETSGPFGSIEDIMNITGIKSGLFNKIKDHITV